MHPDALFLSYHVPVCNNLEWLGVLYFHYPVQVAGDLYPRGGSVREGLYFSTHGTQNENAEYDYFTTPWLKHVWVLGHRPPLAIGE